MTEINNEAVINAIENADVDNIKKVIELFSRYLVCSNNDYYYNVTKISDQQFEIVKEMIGGESWH